MDGHTRGPFHIELGPKGGIAGSRIVAADGTHVCTLPDPIAKPEAQAIADARLLAATPDTTAALEDLETVRAFLHRAMNLPARCGASASEDAPLCGNATCAQVGCMVKKRDQAARALARALDGDRET